MMLHFNRRMGVLLRSQLDGRWIEKNLFDYPELNGQTLAVVGAGSIGSEIGKRARALGMQTFGINSDGRAVEGFDRTFAVKDTADAIADADHVVASISGNDAIGVCSMPHGSLTSSPARISIMSGAATRSMKRLSWSRSTATGSPAPVSMSPNSSRCRRVIHSGRIPGRC